MSCPSNIEFHIQGHRGCRGLFPENSLPAFEKAMDLNVRTIELDIAITKDKKVVVSHEPFMSRTICLKPDGSEIPESEDMVYNLYEMTHKEIKQFDCGTKFHPTYPNQIKLKAYKPLMTEVFQLAEKKKSDVKFNIEIKSKAEYYGIYTPEPNEYVHIVLNEIRNYGFVERSNLQSFDINILEEIHCQEPLIKIALLIDEDEDIGTKLSQLSFKPNIISPYFKLVFKDLVCNYQAQGFTIIPWTVNEESDMKSMLNYGVNAIITDFPNRLIKIIKD